MQHKAEFEVKRRNFLQSFGLFGGIFTSPLLNGTHGATAASATVKDRLWLWCHVAGSYNGAYELPGKSQMTPAEAAFYMSIPNIFMLHRKGTPEPPLAQYALAFEPLREVVWGIVGAGGATTQGEREMVLELALQNRKISGVVMDDFFKVTKEGTGKDGKVSSLTEEELRVLKQRLTGTQKKLDLWVVLYESQLVPSITGHLRLCDVVQLWTWYGQNLEQLETNFENAAKLVPGTRMALGLYWWDFGNKKSLPMSAMQHQCELGLRWLRQGRIEAMVFCGSWLCDRGLETVEWTRQWIQRVGSQKVPARGHR
jgi:hypothetical protein